jgi:hypothetical protein
VAVRLPRHLVAHPWRSRMGRVLHRALDATDWTARDRDPGRAPTQAALEGRAMSHDRECRPRALFAELEIRTSERTGRAWYSAWLGRCRLTGFEADELNERGHRVIKLYVAEPEPRDGPPRPAAKPPKRDPGPRRATEPSNAGACSEGSQRPSRQGGP